MISDFNSNDGRDNSPNSTEYIETAPGVEIYVRDYGQGKPVILIHGWPLSSDAWEAQIEELVANNFRVIAYDRRGFGKSSQPWDGYDYDTLTDDLHEIIRQKNLTNATIVGFSMGGGEAARYFARHGGEGVSKVAFVSAVTPFRMQTADNPDGMPAEELQKMANQVKEDRFAFLEEFSKKFYGVGMLSKPVSSAYLHHDFMIASCASPRATMQCLHAFGETDFRDDLRSVNVPALVIHGDADKTVPLELSGEKTAKLLSDARYLVYEGSPHGLNYTDKDKFNRDLISFLND